MNATRLAGALLALLAATGVARADDELARCAAIPAADARLACFDALARTRGAAVGTGASSAGNAGAAASASPAAASGAAPRTATAAATAATPAAATAKPAAIAAAATVPPAPAATDTGRFGLSAAQLHVGASEPDSISAAVASLSESRAGHTTVVLDNGQIWVIREAGVRLNAGDKVTIRRAALGSYLILTPSRYSYRTSRAQ